MLTAYATAAPAAPADEQSLIFTDIAVIDATGLSRKSPPRRPNRRARAHQEAKEARINKKAEVITLMKRAKSATLAEIMEATGWQAHTAREFVSILGGKGGEKIEPRRT